MSAREDTAGVRSMDGHRTPQSYDGTKCPIKKTPRDKDDRSFRTPSKVKAERNTEIGQEGI